MNQIQQTNQYDEVEPTLVQGNLTKREAKKICKWWNENNVDFHFIRPDEKNKGKYKVMSKPNYA